MVHTETYLYLFNWESVRHEKAMDSDNHLGQIQFHTAGVRHEMISEARRLKTKWLQSASGRLGWRSGLSRINISL
jgi:hypothetical protein